MFACGLSVHQKCSNYALTKLFGLCMSMWVIDLLVTIPSPHLGAPAHLSTPKVLRAKERATTLDPTIVFTIWTHSWIHQGVWGCVKIGGFLSCIKPTCKPTNIAIGGAHSKLICITWQKHVFNFYDKVILNIAYWGFKNYKLNFKW
jgi:hypothetical protein